ncbi:MAG: hypothetical protein AAFP92_17350 [Bacteroidota bacterium]
MKKSPETLHVIYTRKEGLPIFCWLKWRAEFSDIESLQQELERHYFDIHNISFEIKRKPKTPPRLVRISVSAIGKSLPEELFAGWDGKFNY